MFQLLSIPIVAVLDRIRGGLLKFKVSFKRPASLLYGAILAWVLGIDPLLWLPVAVLWTVGAMPGWGYPIGQAIHGVVQHKYIYPNAEPEWWQIGPMRNWPWFSLWVRGVMWGAPVALLYPVENSTLAFPIFMGASLPLAVLLDRQLLRGYGEFIRGALMAAFCYLT